MARSDWTEAWYKRRMELARKRLATPSKVAASIEFYAPAGTPKVDGKTLLPIVEANAYERDTFQQLCEQEGLPCPVREFAFHPGRRWRFDYAWPAQKVAVEVDGGAWTQGRHTRGAGFIEDQVKRNAAVLLGWRVLHCTPDRLHEACQDVVALFRGSAA